MKIINNKIREVLVEKNLLFLNSWSSTSPFFNILSFSKEHFWYIDSMSFESLPCSFNMLIVLFRYFMASRSFPRLTQQNADL